MQTYLIILKYFGRIHLPYKDFDSEIMLLNTVLNAIDTDSVAMLDYVQADMFNFNFTIGLTVDQVFETVTIIEVLLPVDDVDEIDWHDGGDSIFHFMVEALTSKEVSQVYALSKQNGEFVKTCIGYKVQEQ
jgi:hypothetical protein